MNIVIANGPRTLDNGKEVILFPSRWDSGVPGKAPFQFYPYELAYLSTLLKRELPDAKVTFLDGNLEGWNGDQYIQKIAECEPDVLICECSALTYPTMTRVMMSINITPEHKGRAILCGPMGSYDKQRVIDDGWDDIITGEYELKVLALLTGKIVKGGETGRLESGLVDLDWLPWPEDEDVDRPRAKSL